MQNSFHYLLLANQALVQQILLNDLSDTELTVGQPKILDYLLEHNGSNQTQIAEACCIKKGSLTVLLNRMEKHDIIERTMKDGNRRTFYVYLTPYGEKLAKRVQASFLVIEDQIFENITKDRRNLFMDIFQQINENLTKNVQEFE